MCGIVGVYGSTPDKKLVKRMAEIISHRGPDDEGYYFDELIGLGHKRLSIIDLSTGKQPIFHKELLIVYNGEIYNYKEIRAELEELGRKFKTKSDTEVILQAYHEWGTDAVRRLNGMFAFAIWDKKRGELFIARDRLGIKPLYYFKQGGLLVFASEIKAILEHPSVRKSLDARTLVDYLTFQNTIDEKTFFAGIKKLMPGHWLKADAKGIHIVKYWEPDFSKERMGIKKALGDYRKVLHDSVKRHMISDVPLGCYLSGGFDSGIVSTSASEMVDHVETFDTVMAMTRKLEAITDRLEPAQVEKLFAERNPAQTVQYLYSLI